MACEYRNDIILANEVADFYEHHKIDSLKEKKSKIEYRNETIMMNELEDFIDFDNLIYGFKNIKMSD